MLENELYGSSGPVNADVMIVGEAPGEEEEKAGAPFVGRSGQELTRMLSEAGIDRRECYITNVCKERPPRNDINQFFANKTEAGKEGLQGMGGKFPRKPVRDGLSMLYKEINRVKPKIIIAFGNTSLWALTGEWGIGKWRGSMLHATGMGPANREIRVLPTYHPAAILRQWTWRMVAMHDLRRAAAYWDQPWPEPQWNFTTGPEYQAVLDWLQFYTDWLSSGIELYLSCDLETKTQVACIGLAHSARDAICIPIFSKHNARGYWTPEQEEEIIWRLKGILENPNCKVIGQNYEFDRQHWARVYGLNSGLSIDTMTYHHLLFPALPKALDFLSSLYCRHHVYWKDENKFFDESMDEERFWTYSCTDAARTWEIGVELERLIEQKKLNQPVGNLRSPLERQMKLHDTTYRMTLRGVRVDPERKRAIRDRLLEQMAAREDYFRDMIGEKVKPNAAATWWTSSPQTQQLFYEELGVKPVFKTEKGQRRPTCDDDALKKIAKREPLVRELCDKLREFRSLQVYKSTFADMQVDWDERIRCQWKIDGTETFRFSSSADPWGFGTNQQNLPKGDYDEDTGLELPSIRSMYVPDDDYEIADADLEQADAQIVAWEAGCEGLKSIFKDPSLNLHDENCNILYGRYPTTKEERESPHGIRQFAKHIAHACNYGATEGKLAMTFGLTKKQAADFQRTYFGMYPEVLAWQEAVEYAVQTERKITNVFGYERQFFDRPEDSIKEALAWVPQSCVALIICEAMLRLEEKIDQKIKSGEWSREYIHLLLQVHDSLVAQFHQSVREEAKGMIEESMLVPLPYEDPLTIGTEVKTSAENWGGVK